MTTAGETSSSSERRRCLLFNWFREHRERVLTPHARGTLSTHARTRAPLREEKDLEEPRAGRIFVSSWFFRFSSLPASISALSLRLDCCERHPSPTPDERLKPWKNYA